ncbi:TRAP transporter substrate-binding protein [Comamonas sp. C11]|uniref:TRAP transporter substrate-binding protein n=1 Tax=Comamonas sp. C11 TaxID=2966554 RepID=UPI0021134963|nr:TRAP transporter substrate-binding protein [Comamonas sp. C11]UUC92904.1 TRAP transporter substrate-binding protein [Comamonas sp. C11]
MSAFHPRIRRLGLAIAAGLLAAGAFQAHAQDIKERKIKLSYPVAKDNPMGLAVDKFAEIVGTKSDGKIKVTGYPNATLGNEIQSMASAQGGILEMSVVSTAGAAGNVKELAIFDLPFIFRNEKEADAVVDGEVGQSLLKKFPEKKLIGLCYLDYGFRQVTNSKHPIRKLEDFSDLKLRTLQNRVYIDIFKALGATPLPLPYPETYTALETKAIDGQESAYLVTKSSSYQDIQTYLTETRHVYLPAVVLVSKKFWDRLGVAERDIMDSACKEASAYHRTISRKMEADVVQELVKAGMKFNKIEPAEQERMVRATALVIEKYKPELGADLVKETLATIEKVRKAP